MLFHSLDYLLVFLPAVLLVYFTLNRFASYSPVYSTAGKIWLVLASFYFYCQLVPAYGLLLLVSILGNYTLGCLTHRSLQHKAKWLGMGILFNLGLLFYYKYANFFADNLAAFTGWQLDLVKIALPLGISFFTFTQLAYLVDVYRRQAHEYNLIHYFLFVTYFPHLIAGPILHHKEMMPQFADAANNAVNWKNIYQGMFLFSLGLFKKVMVADTFAQWANAGFDAERVLVFHEAWATSLSYSLQIYFDFSGYTDMALGAALMFNIRLPLNFNSPYKAVNIQDFWRRWHMTLSRWLRDYVYIPLGGNRSGISKACFYLGLTFLLGGLWHGANWTFVVWGALHGVAAITHKLWQRQGFSMGNIPGLLLTFLFVNVAWVFFRADNVADALRILQGMAGMHGWGSMPTEFLSSLTSQGSVFYALVYVAIIPLLGFVWWAPNSMVMVERYAARPVLSVVWIGGLWSGILFVLVYFSARITEFIYFNF